MSYTEDQKQDFYARSVKKWGTKLQSVTAMKEAAEFIQALSKHMRYNNVETQDALAEELCDLRLMLGQVEFAYGLRKKAAAAEDWKLQRLDKRLEE